jgi:transcriptional regulator with XRE-family HTH domain
VAKLDELKSRKGIATNAELARHLHMSKQGLAHVRAGRQELSTERKLDVLLELGGDVSESDFESLFSRKTRIEAGDMISRIFDPDSKKEFTVDFWLKRVEELKEMQDVGSDYELCRSLSISPTMLSEQRKGKDGLSSIAKIKILDALGYAVARDGLLSLLPPKIRKRIGDYDKLRFVARGKKKK